MNREQALQIVHEFIQNENLVRHMLAVEAAMRFYARKFEQDEETWGIVGLLHDFDWEIHPTLEQHPQAGAPILRSRICTTASTIFSSATVPASCLSRKRNGR